jgi:hypothetical protein
MSDTAGLLELKLTVPSSWKPGVYDLSVDGEVSPQKIYVMNGPAIRMIRDTLPVTLRAGDSVIVSGKSFIPGERVDFYFDSIPIGESLVADSSYEFLTMLRIPYVPDRSYILVARGAKSGIAVAQDRITITRTLRLEFEEMMPPVDTTPSKCWAENISYFWDADWSKQMLVYFQPDTPIVHPHVTFAFPIYHADTFAMDFHGSIGFDLGNYTISLDGVDIKTVNFWTHNPYWDPQPSGAIPIGTHYLTEGRHTITFTCLGKSDSSRNYWVEPDVLVLTPTTYMPPLPGTILSDVQPGPGETPLQLSSLLLRPNPSIGSDITITCMLPAEAEQSAGSSVVFQLYDELGRKRKINVQGRISEGVFSGSFSAAELPAGVYYLTAIIGRPDGYSAGPVRARFIRE